MNSLADIPSLETNEQGIYPLKGNHYLEKKDGEDGVEVLPSPVSPQGLEEFPDGGLRAWAVVLGLFLTLLRSYGYISSWGIFQVYYQEVLLPHSSPSQIAWIGSVQRCIIFAPGVIVGRLFDLGYFRLPFATGSLFIIAATFIIPVCKVYWHFLLCQGFMIGMGCGLTFGTSATIITHWWKQKRGLALGVASCGSLVGGVFFPIVLRQVLPRVGFTWTLRIMGFILIFTLSMANLCLTRRLPPQKAPGGLFGLHVFRRAPFSVYCLSCLITPLGAFTVATYIATSAVLSGLSSNFAFYLIAILNGSSLLGALGFGWVGDRLGAMNVLIQTIAIIGVVTIAWPFCSSAASLSIIGIIYGMCSGAFSALGQVPVAAMGGTEDLGRRMGTVNAVLGLGGLCGPHLGGLLTSTSLGYKAVGYFSGMNLSFSPAFVYSLLWLSRFGVSWRHTLCFGSIFKGADALGKILSGNSCLRPIFQSQL
ncbi:MFS general substrate transporter [Mycena leptocephala]|nr:MFS general substrate transporter [Mycena leptocephala]